MLKVTVLSRQGKEAVIGLLGAGDFFGEGLAAVPEIAGGEALGAGEIDGGFEQAGALHADADDAEVDGWPGGPFLGVGGLGKGDDLGGESK